MYKLTYAISKARRKAKFVEKSMTRPYKPFGQFVNGIPPISPLLPLMRTITSLQLDRILSDGQISPHDCPTFKEELLYFFYGRAAYRLEPMDLQSQQKILAPAVLIFRPGAITNIRRIFPFDSGGYPHGYKVLDRVDKAEFELATMEHADQTVQRFWPDRSSYFWFQTTDLRPLGEVNPSAHAHAGLYHSLLSLEGDADDRRGTIEISSAIPVEFSSKSLLGLVISNEMMQRPEVLRLTGVRVRPFNWHGGRAIEYFGLVKEAVEEILKEDGYW